MAAPDIIWYKDGVQLEDAGSTRRLSNGTYKAELLITSVQYSDSGFYKCAVQNQFGVSSGNVTLTAKGELRFKPLGYHSYHGFVLDRHCCSLQTSFKLGHRSLKCRHIFGGK